MGEIRFNDGLQSFNINCKVEVLFNPTDSDFAQRIYKTFESLERKQNSYKEEISKMQQSEIFDFAKARDAEMRQMIDEVFDAPVSDAVFGKMNVYAMADGLPVWCNLLLAVMDELDSGFAREQKATNPRIQKYTAKYHR